MTFRRSAPATLIVAAVIVVAGITFLSDRLFSGLTASVEKGQFELMQSIVDTTLRNAANDALARADIIASLPMTTRQAVAAKDRERLLAEYAEMFAVQKERRGVDQAQFHVPPAQSLLRLHAPASLATTSRASARWWSRSIASEPRATASPLPRPGRRSSALRRFKRRKAAISAASSSGSTSVLCSTG